MFQVCFKHCIHIDCMLSLHYLPFTSALKILLCYYRNEENGTVVKETNRAYVLFRKGIALEQYLPRCTSGERTDPCMGNGQQTERLILRKRLMYLNGTSCTDPRERGARR